MGCIINIENIVTNGLKDNSNVSVGCVVQNSHTANTKSVGACFSFETALLLLPL
ncbi:spore germination protein [Priestia megaterium]